MLVFILPMILILSLISYMNNKRERMELESLTETNALQLADVMLGSLNHAMMMNDKGMLSSVLGEIGKNPSIEEVSIVASDATVFISTDLSKIGLKLDLKDVGCIDVLQFHGEDGREFMHLRPDKEFLRVSTSIPNAPQCQACHSELKIILAFL